jgi:transcriptional regulator with XRE-family HTH domain
MEDLGSIRLAVVSRRKALKLRQEDLAARSHVSLPTIKALEQDRLGELGFSKIVRILAALGMELSLRNAIAGRPTLDDLRNEASDD